MEDPVSGRRGSTPIFDDVGKMMEDHFYENECIKYGPYKRAQSILVPDLDQMMWMTTIFQFESFK